MEGYNGRLDAIKQPIRLRRKYSQKRVCFFELINKYSRT
jgi:hypothetical protein